MYRTSRPESLSLSIIPHKFHSPTSNASANNRYKYVSLYFMRHFQCTHKHDNLPRLRFLTYLYQNTFRLTLAPDHIISTSIQLNHNNQQPKHNPETIQVSTMPDQKRPERVFNYRPSQCPGHEWGKISHNGTDYQFWVCDKCGRHCNTVWQCQKCGTTLCPNCHDRSPNVTGKDVKMPKYL